MKTCWAKMVLVSMISLGEAPAATLVAVEEIFLPVVEMLEAVETRVILTPPQMAILTPPFPICESSYRRRKSHWNHARKERND